MRKPLVAISLLAGLGLLLWLTNPSEAKHHRALGLTTAPVEVGRPVYFSKVLLDVCPDGPILARTMRRLMPGSKEADEASGQVADSAFFVTQLGIVRKPEVLSRVVNGKLDLKQNLAPGGAPLSEQQAIALLDRLFQLNSLNKPGLIEVGVWHPNRQMAIDLANSLAAAYQEQRWKDHSATLEGFFRHFEDELRLLKKSVGEAGIEARKFRDELGIADPDPENLDAPLPVMVVGTATTYRELKAKYLGAKRAYETSEARLDSDEMIPASVRMEPVIIRKPADWPRSMLLVYRSYGLCSVTIGTGDDVISFGLFGFIFKLASPA